MNIRQTCNAYRDFRKLVMPDGYQSMLFLISEMGELSAAWMSSTERKPLIMRLMSHLGRLADLVVSGQAKWVRNGDRAKAPNMQHEIGDVLFMLETTALALGLPPADECMMQKFQAKGFEMVSARAAADAWLDKHGETYPLDEEG